MTTIGLDLDNTLACYEGLFSAAAIERGLVPPDIGSAKNAVRDYLRAAGREDDWTELQGHVYGPGMEKAKPFPGALDFLRRCRERGARALIVSHRTPKPFRGPAHDLHAFARTWLERNGFFAPDTGLKPEHVFLEATKEDKLRRIGRLRCDDFVDDLPEFLREKAFPIWTRRWLFSESSAQDVCEFPRISSWAEASRLFFDTPLPPGAVELLGTESASCRLLPGAANNKVYAVETPTGRVVLKHYFRHESDPRDRLGAEWAFSQYAWSAGLRQLPRPIAKDEARGLAVYEHVEGRKISADEVDDKALGAALGFLRALDKGRAKAELPDASEACFSVRRHIETVEKRIERVSRIDGSKGAEESQALEIARELAAAWPDIKARTRARVKDFDGEIPAAEKLISPSDFGFHNSLSTNEGRLVFLDFEYAGWDDPAKLVCDFFCQPAVPVPMRFFDKFADAVCAITGADKRRVEALLPVYKVKWSCIVLNEFSAVDRRRREFAAAPARRAEQIAKARALLA